MMTRLPGVARHLALAFRQVSAAYNKSDHRPPDIGKRGALESEIDAACRVGDRDRALAAIDAWTQDQLRRIREAA